MILKWTSKVITPPFLLRSRRLANWASFGELSSPLADDVYIYIPPQGGRINYASSLPPPEVANRRLIITARSPPPSAVVDKTYAHFDNKSGIFHARRENQFEPSLPVMQVYMYIVWECSPANLNDGNGLADGNYEYFAEARLIIGSYFDVGAMIICTYSAFVVKIALWLEIDTAVFSGIMCVYVTPRVFDSKWESNGTYEIFL